MLNQKPPDPVQLSADDELTALRIIAEETATATGDAFFRTLVEHLARTIGTHRAFVARFIPPNSICMLSYWSDGRLVPNIEYELTGTPCAEVIEGGLCFYPRGLEEKYADSEPGIQSYLGVPLISTDGRILGHLCAFDEAPMAATATRDQRIPRRHDRSARLSAPRVLPSGGTRAGLDLAHRRCAIGAAPVDASR